MTISPLLNLDNSFPQATGFDVSVSSGDIPRRKVPLAYKRPQLSVVSDFSDPCHDLAVMDASSSCLKGNQSKNSGVRRAPEGEPRECMRPPTKATRHMTGVVFGCLERRVECCATEGVVDDVETFSVRVLGDILVYALLSVADRRCSVGLDDRELLFGDSRKDLGSESPSDGKKRD